MKLTGAGQAYILKDMTNRDLLHKPMPLSSNEELKTDKTSPPAPQLNKLGVQNRSRDLGGESQKDKEQPSPATSQPVSKSTPTPAKSQKAGAQPVESETPARGPAYRSAYFNRDVASTQEANPRAQPMRALRGDEGATDLKKVVLPPPLSENIPNPEYLQTALELMRVDDLQHLDLGGLLGRQGAWSKAKGVTAEMIQQRLTQLQQMVEARLAALKRIQQLPKQQVAKSATLAQAMTQDADAVAQTPDLEAAGRELIASTVDQASGLHQRLSKVLGVKKK